jgi:hypothetical protein
MSVDAQRLALAGAVRSALEGLAFTDAAPAPADSKLPDDAVWSWVKVTEPWPATLVLAVPPPAIRAVAATMLGAQPSAGDERDAQAELTNVVAGRLVNGLIGSGLAVSLGIPRVGRGAPDVDGSGWIAHLCAVAGATMAAYWRGGEGSTAAPGSSRAIAATPPTSSDSTQTLAPSELPSMVGHLPERFGNYRIISLLGEGGMGQVYKAHHLTLERTVALKAMRPELSRDPTFTARFLREARSAALIDHANVVPVYDAGVESGSLYIAMRFVGGGDLAMRLREHGPLPEADALALIEQCLRGLQAIAASNLVHRDLKPANVLLEADGTPRLGDLGLARSVDADDGLSRAGAPQGTPCFMSPEQARGAAVDIRSDIYSMGATLYAMIAGAPPFQGDSAYETVAKVLTLEPAPLRRVASVSVETEALVAKSLAKDTRDRFQDVGAFLSAVAQARAKLEGVPATGTPAAGAAAGSRWFSRWLGGKRGSDA